jgi:SUKH-3 immunity protein
VAEQITSTIGRGTVTTVTDGVDWLRVPGAARRPVLPAQPPPDWIDGFRFARTADGVNDDGSPRISPERGYVTDPDERERLLAYLTGAATVIDSSTRGQDLIDPTRQYAVPASLRTDGTWVWPGSVEYYLRWHNVAPEPELRARIGEHGYRSPPVQPATLARARAAADRRGVLVQERLAAYLAEHPELRPGDPDRYPAEVNDELLALGWNRGRDLGREVEDWLAPRVAAVPYPPFPAALSVMREFGRLDSQDGGAGRTMARMPFTIYPAPAADLAEFAPEVRELGRVIGVPVFQVGEVERGIGALVIDETGRVYLAGPVTLYAGATIDEALGRMLLGIRCEELPDRRP